MGRYIYILFFDQIGIGGFGNVNGKNVFRGQIYNQLVPIGISIPMRFDSCAPERSLCTQMNNPDKTLLNLFA